MFKVLPKVVPLFPYDEKRSLKMKEKRDGASDLSKQPPKAKKSKIKFVAVDLKSRNRRKRRQEEVQKGKPITLKSKSPHEEFKMFKKQNVNDISKIILGNLENALEKAKKKKKKKSVENVALEKKNPPPLKKLLLGKTEDEKNILSKKIKNILNVPHDIKFVDEDAKKYKKKVKKSLSAKKVSKEEEMKVKRALSEEKLLKRFVKNGMTLPTDKVERKKIIDRLWQTKRSLWKKRAQIMKQLEETSRAELKQKAVNEQGDQAKTYVVPETVKAKGKNNIESVVYFDADSKEKPIKANSQDDFSKLAKPKIKTEKKPKINNIKANKEIFKEQIKQKEKREKKKKKAKPKVKVENLEVKEEIKKEIEKPHLPERTYKKMVKDVANFIKKEEKKIISDLHEKIKSDNLDEKEQIESVPVEKKPKPNLKSISNLKPNLKAKELKRPKKIISRAASRSRNVPKAKPQIKKQEMKIKEKIKVSEPEPEVEKPVEVREVPKMVIKKPNVQSELEIEKMLKRKEAFAQRLRVQMEQNKRVFVEMTKKKDPSKLRVVSRNDDTDISLSAPLSLG